MAELMLRIRRSSDGWLQLTKDYSLAQCLLHIRNGDYGHNRPILDTDGITDADMRLAIWLERARRGHFDG